MYKRQHVEAAGIHSGDSACSLPPYTLSAALQDEMRRQTAAMARALGVVGLMNVQFAIQGTETNDGADAVVYVLEVNPRASRTVPFVSKATGQQLAKIAARCMAGQSLASQAGPCLLYTSDAADERSRVDLGGRRILKQQ